MCHKTAEVSFVVESSRAGDKSPARWDPSSGFDPLLPCGNWREVKPHSSVSLARFDSVENVLSDRDARVAVDPDNDPTCL